MANGQWLRNEPSTWHEVNRALQDISILLQYLGELPDARLLAYFKDTQAKLADAGARRTVPPCETYATFLNRLLQITAAFQTGREDLLPRDEPGTADGECSPVAFLYWSRDFLSAVAAPATADSIRLTRDYLVNRAWLSNLFRSRRAVPANPAMPALPPDLDAPTRDRLARRLAGRVRRYEWATIGAVVVTLGISIYALSGRLILNNEQAMRDTWSKMDAKLEAEEEKVFKAPVLPIGADARAHLEVVGLCDFTRELPAEPARSQVADSGKVKSDASPSGPSLTGAEPRTAYALPQQAHLCADRAKALLDLFVVTVHLQSWNSAITTTLGKAFSIPFGVVPATLHSFAEGGQNCEGLRPRSEATRGTHACEQILWDEIDRSRHVAESVLGAITQYVLPVLYGFLGAMAGTLRLLRRKVDGFMLSYTDRSRLQQGAILGVLCGGVIGLFATYLGGANPAGNVGISAIALLAGYNVDGVFRFLDELSDRLFRPGTPTKAG